MSSDFSNISSEELALRVKSGDYDCFLELITRTMPHIRATALKWKTLLPDTDDLVSEGVTALFKAVNVYNEDKASFATFANICVDRAIGAKAKSELSSKRIPGNMIVPIEDETVSCESAEETVIRKEENNLLKQDINRNLTELEKNVLAMFLDGESYLNIAERLSISVKSVDGALQRVRNKLKNKP